MNVYRRINACAFFQTITVERRRLIYEEKNIANRYR